MGNSIHEQERLKMQAKFLQPWSEQFFLSAGLEPGMRVLDLGCGMGDVSLLVAKLVGPSGRVTGIDRDRAVIEKARERVRDEESDTQIEFLHTDLFSFHADRSFDAVVGRYVLLYQPDPVAAIRHAAEQDDDSFWANLFTKWIWQIAFNATQTGHSLRRCMH